ncbi:signal transduction histidine kinase [Actinoplanes octamycinicus]|uniref:histidine kinase n=1 Tax=Actinoplanes octamycinicus TaxID=135948 RepID=A0A7W7GZV6_9ACTN|nr:ATP-binding protein [Actinoplanes octamycinicus]MBB4741187.1 signal transduction histidine kinase [Actinoplanes octamycinicus]GIE56093.1 hypothetical protein Aoc01nite_14950 [Actinoplanes octamycinicus]
MWNAAVTVALAGLFWVLPAARADSVPRILTGVVLALVVAAAMLLRRRAPLAATLTAGAATLAGTALGVCQDPMLATAWCLYPLAIERAARARRLVIATALLVTALALVAGVPDGTGHDLGVRIVVAVAALSTAWLLGTAVGRQLAAAREAERARVQLALARDVHDVVGHALGVIAAEAGVVLSLPDAPAEELRETLAGVAGHARTALVDVQALVRSLRAPQRWDLTALAAGARAAGVRVELDADEEVPVSGVAYRVVQEGLSNVMRHAPGSSCSVSVRRVGGSVLVEVRDDGAVRPAGPPGSGLGLIGMRERVAATGGTVSWGERPGGGFAVTARLPVEEPA